MMFPKLIQMAYRRDKLEAEVAKLNRLMVGWKQRATMSETDLEASKAEVERLRSQLNRAVEIADSLMVYFRSSDNWNEAEARLAALKAEIRITSISESADNLK
jgi:multidrug resistance efflux pump